MSLKNKSLVGTRNTHMLMFVNIKDENSVTRKNIGNEKKNYEDFVYGVCESI
jgi:hypothetical protein